MKKMEIPIGKKVRGYGLLNEYGEFDFIPEQTGARQGQVKVVCQTDDYTLSTTKNYVVVHFRMEKKSGLELIKTYLGIVNVILDKLRFYEF